MIKQPCHKIRLTPQHCDGEGRAASERPALHIKSLKFRVNINLITPCEREREICSYNTSLASIEIEFIIIPLPLLIY